MNKTTVSLVVVAGIFTVLALGIPVSVFGHCDTVNGPVIAAARVALEKGDITSVLKWIKKDAEPEVRAAFKKVLAVRSKGAEAKDLADTYFFETLVRIHRAGEGAPYTGIKNEPVEPIVALADKALETGSVDEMIRKVTSHVAEGIKERFNKALEMKKESDKSVNAGREFVEAYVQYMHYVEGIHNAVMSAGGHHHE